MTENANSVITFWLEAGPKKWFTKDDSFDAEMIRRFSNLHAQAASGELDDWANNAEGCLALILILDQFSRNMFRGDPKSFAQDEKCLHLARTALDRAFDDKVNPELKSFIYMPFMHSEDLADQHLSLKLQTAGGGEGNIKAAKQHLEIIEKFGRFPHRNEVLGRHSSPEEIAYLDEGGFKG